MPFKDPAKAKEYFRAYNATSTARARRTAYKKTWQGKEKSFVAIDSEGFSFGDLISEDGKNFRQHKTFLWGAGDKEGECDFLYNGGALGTEQICEWLLKLPKLFGPSIFVSFAFGYDAAQLVADLPYEKVWELQKGRPFDKPEVEKNSNRVVFWKNYGFQFLKGKKLCIYKFPPAGPYKDTKYGRRLCPLEKIMIYDVFGFYQSSFIKAATSMPGAITPDELALISSGKKQRAEFRLEDAEFIKRYTTAELVVLSRMMTLLRDAMKREDIKLRTWYGAGSIAQALLKREGVKEHYPEIAVNDAPKEQMWAHHAFFGGRIELIKQGNTNNVLHQYDIASAYPAICRELPSMRDGTWTSERSPSRARIMAVSALSIVHVQTRELPNAPFYPLPYRLPSGSILFPREVNGYYMVREVRAALLWAEKFNCVENFSFPEMLVFTPGDPGKPFAFVQKLFDYRKSLKKTDITQIVIKLGINALYGKQAQGVGGTPERAPIYCNPWYAAAITAGTRARLLEAALTAPNAIVMLATDGIVSTRELPLDVPAEKTLGAWEHGKSNFGGTFVQSGVYSFDDGVGNSVSKSRGFRPHGLDLTIGDLIRREIPQRWQAGVDGFGFRYASYMTIGASVVSRETFAHVGRWIDGERVLDIDSAGTKRRRLTAGRARRAVELVATSPSDRNMLCVDDDGHMLLSAQHRPEWLDADAENEREAAKELEALNCRFFHE